MLFASLVCRKPERQQQRYPIMHRIASQEAAKMRLPGPVSASILASLMADASSHLLGARDQSRGRTWTQRAGCSHCGILATRVHVSS